MSKPNRPLSCPSNDTSGSFFDHSSLREARGFAQATVRYLPTLPLPVASVALAWKEEVLNSSPYGQQFFPSDVFPEGSEYLPVVIGPGTDRLGDFGPETDNLGDTNSNEILSGVNGAFTPPRGATTPRAATSSPLAVYHSLPVESSPRESSSSQTQSELSSLYRVTQRPGGLGIAMAYHGRRSDSQDSTA
ncbi:hypothetical protein K435DRAFT_866881 [Dendrothele bispora CBS 962.96]|uniref:Uncharacterized protein n=1 Tax=Dendrothele bispora (strain CBS 962.96) TaxID=1314807 RepID=A0A4S8LFP8_DENBC|nr:hypothetical protein K435DRAFT_866881 [Dendrothele bispora CBS 962.96]